MHIPTNMHACTDSGTYTYMHVHINKNIFLNKLYLGKCIQKLVYACVWVKVWMPDPGVITNAEFPEEVA